MPSNLWQSHLTGQIILQRISLYPMKMDLMLRDPGPAEYRMTHFLMVEMQGHLCTCKTTTHLSLEWENWPKNKEHLFVVYHTQKPFSVLCSVCVLTWMHLQFAVGTPYLCTQHNATIQDSNILSLGFLRCRVECWIAKQKKAASQNGSASWMLLHLFPRVSWISHRFNLTLCVYHSTRFLVTQQGWVPCWSRIQVLMF